MLPSIVYDRLRVLTRPSLRRWIKRQGWFVPLSRTVFGNGVYSESYFRDIERIEASSVAHMARWIREALAPRRAIDVGCGPGHLLAALRHEDIAGVGVDVSDAALKAARDKGLDALRVDLTTGAADLPGAPYDLAISCEVAEHLEARFADDFVRLLARSAPIVYLTAAEPERANGVGLYHVNEQPHEYWIARFVGAGMQFDARRTEAARAALRRDDVAGYLQRPLIFSRPASSPAESG